MRKIIKYINGSWPLVFLAPLLMVLEVMCDLMQPTLMSEIVDVGIASGEISLVWSTGLKMLGVALLGIIGGAGCTILSSKASFDSAARLRQGMFDKIQTFSFKEIDKLQTSSLITRLTNDVTILQQTLRAVLCMMVRAPLSCIGGLVMAVAISQELSVIFVVAMPVLAIAVIFVALRTFPMFAKMQQKIDRVNTVMRENLLGVRVIKAFVGQEKEKQRFQGANEDLMNWALQPGQRRAPGGRQDHGVHDLPDAGALQPDDGRDDDDAVLSRKGCGGSLRRSAEHRALHCGPRAAQGCEGLHRAV